MGQNKVTFWDRRSWHLGITRWNMGQNKLTFWDRRNSIMVITIQILKVTFWDRRIWYWAISRRIWGLNEMFFWDRRGQFWIIIRLIMGHEDVAFWVIRRWIKGHNKMNYGTKQGHFLGYWKVILVHIRRWSHGRFQDDNNILHKMKKWSNYQDMAGWYLMPHEYHFSFRQVSTNNYFASSRTTVYMTST